jgi:inhibitor of the pro-sigma K processing machinery
MPLEFDTGIMIFFAVILVMVVIIKLLRSKAKRGVKIIFQIVLGGVFILLFNYVGGNYEITIPLNPLTAFITGVFQIPGIALLLVIKYIIYA